ncbi:MAG: hypothetical protein EB127_09830 [Alphaproteobacteria bacterium]|nr:hypothetical protein [Alphaproteobacteria bacterium]
MSKNNTDIIKVGALEKLSRSVNDITMQPELLGYDSKPSQDNIASLVKDCLRITTTHSAKNSQPLSFMQKYKFMLQYKCASNENPPKIIKKIYPFDSNMNLTEDDLSILADFYRAIHGDVESLKNFIMSKRDEPNLICEEGLSPLTLAIRNNSIEMLEYLLENGANPNIRNCYKETPIMEAARLGKVDCLDFLLKQGVDVNIRNNNNFSAIMLATVRGHNKAVELLLQYKANPDILNCFGNSCLIEAAKLGNEYLVKLFLATKSDPLILNHRNYSALILSSMLGKKDCVEILMDHLQTLRRADATEEFRAFLYSIKHKEYESVKIIASKCHNNNFHTKLLSIPNKSIQETIDNQLMYKINSGIDYITISSDAYEAINGYYSNLIGCNREVDDIQYVAPKSIVEWGDWWDW